MKDSLITMRKTLPVLIIIVLMFFTLNINVSTRQGINYQWKTLKIPLYLKLLDFFDRHYNYKELAKKVTAGSSTYAEKASKIFDWTTRNIREVPAGMPVMDDHAWYIIIRGYGASDQSSDVFTTLCNYAGIDAFFFPVYSQDRKSAVYLSVARLNKKWFIFDPFNGVYFTDSKGEMIDIDSIRSGREWKAVIGNKRQDINYRDYLADFPSIKNMALQRSSIQSPFNRFIYEIRRRLKPGK